MVVGSRPARPTIKHTGDTMTLTPEFIETLKNLASTKTWGDTEDFDVYNYSGGNFDDAFEGGVRAGVIYMARDVLDELNISW